MKTREEILKESIENGEVIKVRYYGGSTPGAERELIARKILPDGYVRCFCLRDLREKMYFLNKIEIDGMDSSDFVNKENLDYLSNYQKVNESNSPVKLPDMPIVLEDFIVKNWQAWINAGWYVNIEINSLSLHSKRKDEKPVKKASIHIQYEDMRYYTTDYSGKKPIALFQRNEKPWMVQSIWRNTVSFADFDKAMRCFVTLLSLKEDKPLESAEPKPKLTKSAKPKQEPELKLEPKSEQELTKLEDVKAIDLPKPAEPQKWYKQKLKFSEIILIILLISIIFIIIPSFAVSVIFLIEGKFGDFIGLTLFVLLFIFIAWKIFKKIRQIHRAG